MSDHYILEDKTVKAVDLMTWATWYETAERRVKRETIGNSDVSTVFLGIDHAFGDEPPQLFETLVFGGPLADEMTRCATYEEAEAMHKVMCDRVRGHSDFVI
jgi:hypothetical protein